MSKIIENKCEYVRYFGLVKEIVIKIKRKDFWNEFNVVNEFLSIFIDEVRKKYVVNFNLGNKCWKYNILGNF